MLSTGIGPAFRILRLFASEGDWQICCTAIEYRREVAAGVPSATAGSTLVVTIEIV